MWLLRWQEPGCRSLPQQLSETIRNIFILLYSRALKRSECNSLEIMEIWFIILIVAEIELFLLYIYYLKKYPILYMPFDSRYRVFKRTYRAYKPVQDGKKLNKLFAEEFLCVYKHTCEGKIKGYSGESATANRLCNIIENGLEKKRTLILNEIKESRGSIDE